MSAEQCELLCLELQHAEEVRESLPELDEVQVHAARFKALGDPLRLRIATALHAGEELCGCDLAWICRTSPNLVSHHVRVLRSAELAASRREGKLVMHRLTDTGHRLLTSAGLVTGRALPTTSLAAETPDDRLPGDLVPGPDRHRRSVHLQEA